MDYAQNTLMNIAAGILWCVDARKRINQALKNMGLKALHYVNDGKEGKDSGTSSKIWEKSPNMVILAVGCLYIQ